MNMIKMKTKDLTEVRHLAYAVLLAQGAEVKKNTHEFNKDLIYKFPSSARWNDVSNYDVTLDVLFMLYSERIHVCPITLNDEQAWQTWRDERGMSDEFQAGRTPLVAICRCFIASKLGDTVEIPEELCR